MTKPALSYYIYENAFHNCKSDWIVGAPELGFLFPAFDDRSSNIYNALYYSRDIKENHKELVDAVFNTEIPMPAAEQKEAFQNLLEETLDKMCIRDRVMDHSPRMVAAAGKYGESAYANGYILSLIHI